MDSLGLAVAGDSHYYKKLEELSLVAIVQKHMSVKVSFVAVIVYVLKTLHSLQN